MKSIFGWVTLLLLWAVGTPIAKAQEDFNPDNPPEPNIHYKVTVSSNPKGIYVSGGGSFTEGSKTFIYANTSSGDYKFSYWTLNGEFYSSQRTFYYIVEPFNASFVAHFEEPPFDPTNPAEPTEPDEYGGSTLRTLTLTMTPQGSCTFNLGESVMVEMQQWIEIAAYPELDYDFNGWYQDGQKLSDATSFYYQMPETDVTLVARFTYNPQNPSEPSGGGIVVPEKPVGDANGDGTVNVTDAVYTLNTYLNAGEYNSSSDMNNDGVVNVTDVVMIINKYLGNN